MARAERNSDGSYDAVDSGGFGKDYHGQDAFGERIGGSGIGGSHFGGRPEGYFSNDKGDDTIGGREGDNYVERYTNYGQAMATESPTEVGDATEVASNMKDTLRDVNSTETENSNTGSMDTSFQIGDINEDKEKEKNQQELKKAEERLRGADSSFEGEANEVADSMRESIQGVNEETTENSNTDSQMDTGFQIGGIDEDLEKARQEKEEAVEEDKGKERLRQAYERAERELNVSKEWVAETKALLKVLEESTDGPVEALLDASGPKAFFGDKLANKVLNTKGKAIDHLESLAKTFELDDFDRNKLEEIYKEDGPEGLRKAQNEIIERGFAYVDKVEEDVQRRYDYYKSEYESYKSPTTDKTKTSFTDKMKPSTTKAKTDKPTEAKPGPNMANAKTSPSDYITKANKDSTKELPPDRNDFGNHAADTLKGVTDRIAGSVTADALGLKSIEEFAKENGYDPNKFSTMKAYQSYQNKEIMKAVPSIVKQIGSYIVERVKDVVDPSQLGERVRNTIARYNLATLIGAAILSIKSGAGIQASIDQALTMVDTEDQPAVSDYLEDVLSDEGTVNDLGNAFDDALAPEQNSYTNELDESIVNVGRKDNTDYDDFNAGLGTTSSDADVKVFIARNVKADPILRKMISKVGK